MSMHNHRAVWDNLRPPRPPHGKRLLIPQIDLIGEEDPHRLWVSVPVDNSDLAQGYRDITFKQFADTMNATARWLRDNLDLPAEGFPTFAYSGPPDHWYGVFAAAAGKLGYQIIPFGKSVGPTTQQRIMRQKNCTTYLHAQGFEPVVQAVQKIDPRIRSFVAPELEKLARGSAVDYHKSWEEGKDDPWLVLHTSGTTGFPKVVTYSQQQMSMADIVMGLEDVIEDTALQEFANSRCYLPMPPAHYTSLAVTLGYSVWAGMVLVYGPGGIMPSLSVAKDILKHGRVDGALLVPALLDVLCQDPESLTLLRKLKYIQYAGAPLSATTGQKLTPDVRIVQAVGSTEAGGYFFAHPNKAEDWDYVVLQPHTGAVMEHRGDNLHELVFIQHSRCAAQPIFEGRPDLRRFETGDLWVEHSTKKGQWKLVGRSDDLIKLSSGLPLLTAPIELLLADDPFIQTALLGGHGKPKPVMLIELIAAQAKSVLTPEGKAAMIEILRPHIESVNLKCHVLAQLDPRLIAFTTPDKPWPLTVKETPIRSQALKLYEAEIEEAYALVGSGSGPKNPVVS